MCKPKIKKMGGFLLFLTGGNIAAITLAPFGIYMKEKYLSDVRMINHEKIHWAQQMEMAVTGAIMALITGIILLSLGIFSWWLLLLLVFPFIFFYLWYVIEWFLKVITPPSGAYEDIGFEREAYTNDDNLNYLSVRKLFAWFKRIFN